MLFRSMLTNSVSNCFAASRTAFSGAAPAWERSFSRPRGSSALEPELARVAAVVGVISDDLELRAQRAGGFHRLQDRQQILRRRADRVERLDNFAQVGAAHHHELPFVLLDLDLRALGDDSVAAARERRRL